MFDYYPIHELIENRQKQLGLGRNELGRRCGFKNLAKALRRIDGVCHGDLDSPGAKMVLDNLAVALEVDKVVVENAIAATAQVIADANRLAEAEREGHGGNRSNPMPILSVPRIVRRKSRSTA